MDAQTEATAADPASGDRKTAVERPSDRELVVTRTFAAPRRLVWEAWADHDLFAQWWTPESFQVRFVSRESDVRTGGSYRFLMSHPSFDQPMPFFGRYLEVTPPERLVWTNEEAGENGQTTTVTFEDLGEETRVVLHELYPSAAALEEAVASGATSGFPEQFTQLDAFLARRG